MPNRCSGPAGPKGAYGIPTRAKAMAEENAGAPQGRLRESTNTHTRTKILTTSPGAASAPVGPAGPASTRS